VTKSAKRLIHSCSRSSLKMRLASLGAGTQVDFTSGNRNLQSYLDTIAANDMHVFLRLGPYICGEWEFGGFPARLLSYPDIVLRTNNTNYMSEVTNWWTNHLLPEVIPHLIENGGPIVAVQVENEFGSYGNVAGNPNDKAYLQHLIDTARAELGDEILLFTTDGGNAGMMASGSLNGSSVITLGDFGPGADVSAAIEAQASFNPPGMSPPTCAEYYPGWLTHWGEAMALTDSTAITTTLKQMLDVDMSFNLYMAHGGTSYGFWSGVNGGGEGDFEVSERSERALWWMTSILADEV